MLPILPVALLAASTMCVLEAASLRPERAILPPLPDAHGFAGMFAGVSGGALLCAGGANFPGEPLSRGGKKVWHDRVFVLQSPSAGWREAGRLPRPNAYGVSATWRDGLVLAGGGNAKNNFHETGVLRWDGVQLIWEELPPLPLPVANACGAVVRDTLFVCGGQSSLDATCTLQRCFALDLAAPSTNRNWREIPWPAGAPGRILAVAGAHEGWFYIFSGADLYPNAQGAAERHYLTDAWRYHPDHGWQRLPDLPRAAAAAPSPAVTTPVGHLVIVGGVSPGFLSRLVSGDPHPGFPLDLMRYDPGSGTWISTPAAADQSPARVTAPAVVWNELAVVVSGEVAPGIRTPSLQTWRFSP